MNIDWRTKAAGFRLFDALPGGRVLYHLSQRYVTRTLPRNLAEHAQWQVEHARTFRRYFEGPLGKARLFEFGAGWDLHSSFVQWCYGVNHQIVVDISRLARCEQINHVIRHLRDNPPPDCTRVPETTLTEPFEDALRRLYGIRYVAPSDAGRTGLDEGSVDLICTTSVLEHIPEATLHAITRECHRLCHRRSVVSHVVDYSDHYAHADPSITIYNFLRFSDRAWRPFNPALHYQNRLRHPDYGSIFRDAGFRTILKKAIEPPGSKETLASVPLAARFRAMEVEALTPRTGHWVLGKA